MKKELERSLSIFRVSAVLLVASLLSVDSLAGEYQVTYSGGTVTVTFGTDEWFHGYGNLGDGFWGANESSCEPPHEGPGVCGPGSVDCQGVITATFTWMAFLPWRANTALCDPHNNFHRDMGR